MKRNVLAGFTGAVLVAVTMSACGVAKDKDGGDGDSSGDDIVIGAAIAESGFMNANDGPSLAGFQVWMDEQNAKGGINGHKLVLKTEDTTSTKEGGKNAGTKLLDDGAEIMLTSANFDFGAPAGNVAQAKGILNFSLGAASPLYGPVGIGPQAYSTAPSTYLEGHVMAQTLSDLGSTKPFLLTDDSIDYGTQVGEGAAERFDQLGITPAGEATFKNEDSSIATQISKIKSSGADSIALSTYLPGGAAALRQIRAAGIDVPVASDLGMGGTQWAEAVPGLNDFYVTALASIYGDDPDPAVQDFVAKFKDATGGDPGNTQVIEGYNVGQLLGEALEQTKGDTDGAKLSEVLDGLTDFEMLGGSITYTPDIHIKQSGPLTVLKFTDGKPAWFSVVTDSGETSLGQ